jgi:ParB-like chromosome segregation protein Spo0J
MKEQCISLQKSLDVMVADKDDSNYRIISLEENAEEQKIKSDELNELLKVGAKDEMSDDNLHMFSLINFMRKILI